MRNLAIFAVCLLWALRANGASVTLAVIGDYGVGAVQGNADSEGAVATLVKGWQPEFIITTGDNNYYSGAASTIDGNIGQFYQEFIFPYTGAYGDGASSNRFFPSLGNHDFYSSITVEPYRDYFTLPGNERYYRYRHGLVEVFALDSEAWEPDGNTADSIQALWLKDALATSTATWRLVYFHTSPYSSSAVHGSHTGEGLHMRWPFAEWGATAVFTGHDHLYERFNTNGIYYFVNGAGGAARYSFLAERMPGSVVGFNEDWGAQRIIATETNINIEFITRSQVLIDSVTITNTPSQLAVGLVEGAVELVLGGQDEMTYLLQASSDLVNWTVIATNQTAKGIMTFRDAVEAGQPPRFYRAQRAPWLQLP